MPATAPTVDDSLIRLVAGAIVGQVWRQLAASTDHGSRELSALPLENSVPPASTGGTAAPSSPALEREENIDANEPYPRHGAGST